jgi:hypothetical protein
MIQATCRCIKVLKSLSLLHLSRVKSISRLLSNLCSNLHKFPFCQTLFYGHVLRVNARVVTAMQPVCQQCLAVSLTALRLAAPSMLEEMLGRCAKLIISLIALVILLGQLHIHYSAFMALLPILWSVYFYFAIKQF